MPNRLRLGVADEDDIRVGMAADEGELAAVEGPAEVVDLFGCEISELLAWGTIQGLEPEVVGSAVANGINDSFAVASKANRSNPRRRHRPGALEIQELENLAGIDRQ